MQFQRRVGRVKIVIGFMLLGIGAFFCVIGINPESESIYSFFQHLSFGRALMMTLLAILTFNWPQLLSLLIGFLSWQQDDNPVGKYMMIASLILIVITIVQLFLYSSTDIV